MRFLSTFSVLLVVSACERAPAEAPTKKDATSRPTCDVIDEACDPYEDKPGLPKECHDLAEAKGTPEATCVARKAECLAACPKK